MLPPSQIQNQKRALLQNRLVGAIAWEFINPAPNRAASSFAGKADPNTTRAPRTRAWSVAARTLPAHSKTQPLPSARFFQAKPDVQLPRLRWRLPAIPSPLHSTN